VAGNDLEESALVAELTRLLAILLDLSRRLDRLEAGMREVTHDVTTDRYAQYR
jgi:hypothetical protein